jgi:hypothetical protein
MSNKPENYLTWFDWLQWFPSRPAHYTEPYCYHRAKHSCEGSIDWMQVKTVWRNNQPRKHIRALCKKHYEQLLAKEVPFVEQAA